MFGRKSKQAPEQGSDRRQVQRPSGSPAFSYYASRPQPSAERPGADRRGSDEPAKQRPSRALRVPSQISFWLLLAVAAICLVKILLLTTSPKIIMVGDSSGANYARPTSTYQQAAAQILSSSLANRTKLTVNLSGTADALKARFPELQSASVTMPLVSNRPIVYLQVAKPTVLLQSPQGNFALNETGVVLAKAQSVPTDVPLLADQSGSRPAVGAQILPSSTIAFLQTVAYQFTNAHISITTFVLPSGSPYELDVRLDGHAYIVRFNLQADARAQSGAAIATIQQLGSTAPAAYLDVRVPDRVYYK